MTILIACLALIVGLVLLAGTGLLIIVPHLLESAQASPRIPTMVSANPRTFAGTTTRSEANPLV
jgi:hypothetical protein